MTATSSASSSPDRNRASTGTGRWVLLDANALLLPVRSRFPLTAEVDRHRPGARIAVPSSVLAEVDRLAERGVRGARLAARWARTFPAVDAPGRGDAAVLRCAVQHRAWVVTADRALASRLRSHGVSVLVPRDRTRLELHPGRVENPSPVDRPAPRRGAVRRQRL